MEGDYRFLTFIPPLRGRKGLVCYGLDFLTCRRGAVRQSKVLGGGTHLSCRVRKAPIPSTTFLLWEFRTSEVSEPPQLERSKAQQLCLRTLPNNVHHVHLQNDHSPTPPSTHVLESPANLGLIHPSQVQVSHNISSRRQLEASLSTFLKVPIKANQEAIQQERYLQHFSFHSF